MSRLLFLSAAALLLSACGAIESGNVGVRTSVTGSVKLDEMQQPSQVSEIKIKYAGRDRVSNGIWYPAYDLVRSVARAATYEAVSEYDSLTIHQQRDKIKEQIRVSTQKVLDNGPKY